MACGALRLHLDSAWSPRQPSEPHAPILTVRIWENIIKVGRGKVYL